MSRSSCNVHVVRQCFCSVSTVGKRWRSAPQWPRSKAVFKLQCTRFHCSCPFQSQAKSTAIDKIKGAIEGGDDEEEEGDDEKKDAKKAATKDVGAAKAGAAQQSAKVGSKPGAPGAPAQQVRWRGGCLVG